MMIILNLFHNNIMKSKQSKIGRPENEEIEIIFMQRFVKKHLSIISEVNLQTNLIQSFFNQKYIGNLKKNKKTEKKLTKMVGLQKNQSQNQPIIYKIQIPYFTPQEKKNLYQKCQIASSYFQFDQFQLANIPNQFFTTQFDLSFILKTIGGKSSIKFNSFSIQQLIFIAIYCLNGLKVINDKTILFFNKQILFIYQGISYGLSLIQERLSQYQKQKQQSQIYDSIAFQQQNVESIDNDQVLVPEKRQQILKTLDESYQENFILQNKKIQSNFHKQSDIQIFQQINNEISKQQKQDIKKKLKQLKNKRIKKNKKLYQGQKVISQQKTKQICINFINYICYSFYYIMDKTKQEIKNQDQQIQQENNSNDNIQVLQKTINSQIQQEQPKWQIDEIFDEI